MLDAPSPTAMPSFAGPAIAAWASASMPADLSARTLGDRPLRTLGVAALLVATSPLAFLATAALRAFALTGAAVGHVAVDPPADADLPTYTVLVPLYREARVVPDLLRAMLALDYPADRLEVLLLVEEDDRETADAARAAVPTRTGGPSVRVVVVPDGRPRTKPRACNYGLGVSRSDLVVVYDAEDRPEPDQLRRAAAALVADAGLAVVQARLACDHSGPSAPWVTRMWALDYDCLFGAVNPALARLGLPYLLGGTSNHFRRDALASVGGWDAHNVTEDADLSVRLVRAGWRCGVVDSTTWEEAPVTAGAWVRQRSRWLKGFAVTTVVHARDPVRLWREAGPRATLALWAQLPGTLLCVAAYPVGVALACAGALDPASPLTWSMAGGHVASLALAARVAGRGRRRLALTLPAYWALLAWALAVGLLELPRRAGHWAKTEHGVAAGRPVVATVAEVRGDAGLAGSG